MSGHERPQAQPQRRQLPRRTPAAQGVDAAGVLAFLDDLTDSPDVELHSLVLLRHGTVVAEGWWAPYSPERVHLLYSLSKTFTASALALAVAEGLVDLDEPVVGCFPDLAAGVTDERTRAMRVRHLASMSTGHTYDTWEAALAADHAEPVRGFLGLPPQEDPGSVFAYNQSATYTLAALVQQRTGGTLLDYLRPRLLDPLGIGAAAWQQHPTGRDLGFSGLHATTDAVARLGQLYLQDGVWQGQRLLPEGWLAEATRAHVATTGEPAVDWQQGYGFQVWRSQHGYRGDGAYGQFCLVLPEHDAVVAITGQSEDMQRVLDAAWRYLLPAMTDAALDGERDDELAARLGGLVLTGPGGASQPPAGTGWSGAVLAPAGGRCADQPSLHRVQLDRDDAGRWALTLHEDLDDLQVELPRDGERWAVTEPGDAAPVAAAGGWSTDGSLQVVLAFLESPHRLLIGCREPGAGFEARWQTGPLHRQRLAQMRSPG